MSALGGAPVPRIGRPSRPAARWTSSRSPATAAASARRAWATRSPATAADGAIIDDPFGKREDADSPVMRQRVWEWYANDLYTRLSAEAWIVLTHTRWHRDDLAGPAAAEDGRPRGRPVGDPLPAGRPRGGRRPTRATPALPGEPLWPEFKSAADLEIIRRQDARAYAALYQQNPADASAAEWAAGAVRRLDLGAAGAMAARNSTCGWSASTPARAAATGRATTAAIVFMGVAGRPAVYVDAIVDRIPLDQIVRKTIVFCDEKRPDLVGIEAEQFQELLVHEFRRQCGEQRAAVADLCHDDAAACPRSPASGG